MDEDYILLRPGERLDDLECDGLRVIQNPAGFCFGVDALLLVDFARIDGGDAVLELGTGSGVVLILLAHRSGGGRFVGLEAEKTVAERAQRSLALNHMQDRVKLYHADLRQAEQLLGRGQFDVVLANPPYGRASGRALPRHRERARARFELGGTLADWLQAAAAQLRQGGRAYVVYRCARLPELLETATKVGLTPLRLRLVHDAPGLSAALCLLALAKGARGELAVEPPCILHDEAGNKSRDWRRIYHETK